MVGMTGDGAVVRVDRALQYARRHLVQHKDYKLPCGACDLARAYLAQAERLTRERDEEKERADGNYQSFERVRTARADAESRTADLLKALEEYGKHHGICPHSADPFTSQECRCGLVETLAAAKGETVWPGEPKPAGMHDMDDPGTCYHCGAEAHDCKCDGGIS